MSTTEKLKIDDEKSRRIVTSFIDFLNTVGGIVPANIEGLEVTKQFLMDVFKLDASSLGDKKKPLLLEMFQKLQPPAWKQYCLTDFRNLGVIDDFDDDAQSDWVSPSLLMGDDEWTSKLSTLGISKYELIGQYFAALEKMKCFNTTIGGSYDAAKVARVTVLFQDAFMEMEKEMEISGSQGPTYSLKNLADTLKENGNGAMLMKWYYIAIKMYTCAVSLCGNNAIYYCNRAAALTHILEYNEAIRDCERAIEIDPGYVKAYSRIGLAYYAQGSYRDAIDKGFKKALELDPSNEAAKENIQKAEIKLAKPFSELSSEFDPPVEPILPNITMQTHGLPPRLISAHLLGMLNIVGVPGLDNLFDGYPG